MKYLFCPNIHLAENKFLCLEIDGAEVTTLALPEEVLKSFFELEELQKHSDQASASIAEFGRAECMSLSPSEVLEKCEESSEMDRTWIILATFCVGICSNLADNKMHK